MALQNKIAIVTGAGQGMGRGIATKLAREGATVLCVDINLDTAQETVCMIEAAGGKAFAEQADNANINDTKKVFDTCERVFGAPDILCANVGLTLMTSLMEVTEEKYYTQYDINAKGTLFYFKEAAHRLNDGGRIVATSSSQSIYPCPMNILYAGTKAAINMMAKIAALELADRKITVNTVLPGVTDTPSMRGGLPEHLQQNIIDDSPLKRLGTPEDVAALVAFLVSDEGGWVNGQNILVNGGCPF